MRLPSYAAYYAGLQDDTLAPAALNAMFADTSTAGQDLLTNLSDLGGNTPLCFLLLEKNNDRVLLLHKGLFFRPVLGRTPQSYENKLCSFYCEGFNNSTPQLMQFPAHGFNLTNQAVASWEDCVHHCQQHPDTAMASIPATTGGDPTPTIAVRRSCYVPPVIFAKLLALDTPPTVQEIVLLLNTSVTSGDLELDDVASVVAWLRAALCPRARGMLEYADPPRVLTLTQRLSDLLVSVVTNDLGTNPVPSADPVVNTALLTRLAALEHRTTVPQGVPVRTKKKPSEFWETAMINRLLNYLDVTTEDALPPIYGMIANARQTHITSTIQSELRSVAGDLGYNEPTATPALVSLLKTFEFGVNAQLAQDPARGLQPHLTCVDGDTNLHFTRRLVEDLAEHTGVSATISEAREYRQKANTIRLPKDRASLQQSLQGFAVLLAVCLGKSSAVFLDFQSSLVAPFDREIGNLFSRMYGASQADVVARVQGLIRSLQLHLMTYWSQCDELLHRHDLIRSRPHLSFRQLAVSIRVGTWSLPPGTAFSGLPTPPSGPSGDTRGGGPPGGQGANRDASSGGAGNPRDRAPTQSPPSEQNPNPSSLLTAFASRIGSTRTFLQSAGQIPTTDTGNQMCINWHIRGRCGSTCARGRAGGHTTLNSAEEGRMVRFLEDGLARVAAGSGSTST